jgi:hypothetical protein
MHRSTKCLDVFFSIYNHNIQYNHHICYQNLLLERLAEMKKDFDPRFGKHDPRDTPLGRATEALLAKMHKQASNTPRSVVGAASKPQKKS